MFGDLHESMLWTLILRLLGFRKNREKDTKVRLFKKLIQKAKHDISAVAGNIDGPLWTSHEIIEALQKATATKKDGSRVEVKIILNADKIIEGTKNKDILQLWEEGRIELYRANSGLKSHFAVVDRKHIRLEEPHPPGSPHRAWLKNNTFILGDQLASDFDILVNNSHLIPKG